MIHIITCNDLAVDNINKYSENFIISHMTPVDRIPLSNPEEGFDYYIYQKDGNDLEDEYESDLIMQYNFTSSSTITEALDSIADYIIQQEQEMIDEDDREESIVLVVCGHSWNTQVVKYLDSKFAESQIDLNCMDFYKYFKFLSDDQLSYFLKQALKTDQIYVDDPIALGYAVYVLFSGSV